MIVTLELKDYNNDLLKANDQVKQIIAGIILDEMRNNSKLRQLVGTNIHPTVRWDGKTLQ